MQLIKPEINAFKKVFNDYIEKSKRILITSHINPDDDSIASVLALRKELVERHPEKKVEIFYEGDIGPRYDFLDSVNVIKKTENLSETAKKYDLIIYLDANDLFRATRYSEELARLDIKKVRIDHHRAETDSFDLEFVDYRISSTAELLYSLFFEEKDKLDKETCQLLFFGINDDTGGFNFINKNNCHVFSVVERLIREGEISVESFKAQYEKISQKSFELLQKLFINVEILTLGKNPPFSISYLTEKGDYSYAEIKEATNFYINRFAKLVDGVNWSVMIYPRKDSVGVSMRSSIGGVNVRLLAEAIGVGGGHDMAAGVRFEDKTFSEIKEMLLDYLENNQVEILK